MHARHTGQVDDDVDDDMVDLDGDGIADVSAGVCLLPEPRRSYHQWLCPPQHLQLRSPLRSALRCFRTNLNWVGWLGAGRVGGEEGEGRGLCELCVRALGRTNHMCVLACGRCS